MFDAPYVHYLRAKGFLAPLCTLGRGERGETQLTSTRKLLSILLVEISSGPNEQGSTTSSQNILDAEPEDKVRD